MLARLTSWCFDHRWKALGLWAVLLVAMNVMAQSVGIEYVNNFSLPGADSQKAIDLLEERFATEAGDDADLVFKASAGLDDPSVRDELNTLFAEIEKVDAVLAVDGPFEENPFAPPQISEDRTIGYAKVQFEGTSGAVYIDEILRIQELAAGVDREDLEVVLGGMIVQVTQQPEGGITEVLGLVAAVIILLVTFGSALAMGLPLVTALFGIGVGVASITPLSHLLSTPEFAPQMASMIGIGVGIDYALFIVTRQRQGLHEGRSPKDAATVAMDTAGRAVLFAGATVVVALLGMLLAGFEFIEGVAVGTSVVVLAIMLCSITLLPALLGFVGENIDRWGIKRLTSQEAGAEGTFWWRWSRRIQAKPWFWASVSLGLLLALTAPVFSMRLGLADTGSDPEGSGSRRAYDLLAEGFGPGFNGPFLLAAEVRGPEDLEVLAELSAHLAQVEGVSSVSPPVPGPEGDAAIIQLIPEYAPQAAETGSLVRRLRNKEIPSITEDAGVAVYVGGLTPVTTDFAATIAERLPLIIGSVISVSFLLLMLVFRSLLVPLKAAVMNLLSISAAYGVIVAIFQWGWGLDLIGVDKTGPIEAWAPMMLFAILFGLSMDYEVFLLSRIREEYLDHGDNEIAVANGLAQTARVITAAASIMITVFLIFAIGGEFRSIKLFAIGLATAIFIDATVVRLVLVPSTMELLGDRNWWIPKWLDRILPRIEIEAEPEP